MKLSTEVKFNAYRMQNDNHTLTTVLLASKKTSYSKSRLKQKPKIQLARGIPMV